MRTIIRRLLPLTAACLAVPAYTQSVAREYSLEIERQPLPAALTELSKQTGLQIGYFPETMTEKVFVGPLSGRYTADIAIAQLLRPSGFSFQRLNERTIAVIGPESARSERRGYSRIDRNNVDQTVPSFLRLANHRLAPAEDDAEQIRTAAAPQEADDNKRRRRGIEEVIVTAQKREERLQDVPISISVITADEIDRRGLVGAADYLRGVPGANQIEATPAQSIVLRGLEVQSVFQSFNGGERTGTYFGETPTTGSAGTAGSSIDIKLVDIERVEILRGPQGTAFGSSSMGGTVRILPAPPTLDHFEGKVGAGYSFTSGTGDNNYNFEASGNLPLINDKLAVRATGYQSHDSGFYRNRAGSNSAFQAAIVSPQGAEAFATDDDEVGSHYVIGGRIAALLQATDDLRFTINYLTQNTETDGIPLATSGSYEQSVLQVAPEHVRRGQRGGLIDTYIDIVNPVMEYDFGWADLLATYSYVKSGTDYMRPMNSIGSPHARSQAIDSPFRGDSGEVRLATTFDGPWNFLGGFYAENNESDFQWDGIWFGDLAASAFPGFGRTLGTSLERFELKQKAAFGEVSWEFLPDLTFTGGVRAFDYDRSKLTVQSGPFFGGSPPPSVRSAEESGTTFRANLSYQPGDDTHLYASWSQGFRAGGPLGQVPPVAVCPDDVNGFLPGTTIRRDSVGNIESDSVDNYELGGKFALMGRRFLIDAAIFRMDWADMPVTVAVPGCFTFQLNAGEARSEGVELQANFQITDAFRLDFGGAYLNAELTEDVPAQAWHDGDRLPGSPDVNANLSLQYEFDIGGYRAFVRTDSIYVGPFSSVVGVPASQGDAGDYVKLDVMARIMVDSFNIGLFVRNLTNEDAYTFRSPFGPVQAGLMQSFGYQMRPRTIGLQLGYSF